MTAQLPTPWNDRDLQKLLTPKWSKFIPHVPYPKQHAFLLLNCRDAFYGGAAGGGKSDALLMAALQYVDCPGYNALLVRDTYSNLTKPEGLLSRALEWLTPWKDEVRWINETKTFHFLKYNSTLGFGYLDGPRDHFNFLSSAYQFVGVDEATGVREHQALYLFSRLRKLVGVNIPVRFRCASNPPPFEQIARGEWVKKRYVDPKTREPGVVFIPALMTDNKALNAEDYRKSLANLDPITRRQLEEGDWEITSADRFFQVNKIEYVDTAPVQLSSGVSRRWDMAATPDKSKDRSDIQKGPAFTCGVKGCLSNGILYVMDVRRDRLLPGDADQFIKTTATGDGYDVHQVAEQEPGSSGKRDMWHLAGVLQGFSFVGKTSTGSKVLRAKPLASAMAMGKVKFIKGPWNEDAKKELMMFPDANIKDIVDAMAGLYSDLSGAGQAAGASAIQSELQEQHRELDLIYG